MKPNLDLSREYGLVLEGGGARGAYQVGAWKALREAGVKIKGVAGTSVGALNGALICMDDLEKAEEIWENITYSRVLDVEDELIGRLKSLGVKSFNVSELVPEIKKVVSGRGLNIGPLKELIAEVVDEERIRRSPMELYATALSVTDRKEMNFDVKAAPAGAMKDMLLASAFLPGFKQEKLGGKTYMDGGSVNNVPIDVLTDRGYKDIIVIRIYGIGVDRGLFSDFPEDVSIHKIAPRRNLGGILEFDKKKARRNMTLGYFDAMRFLYGLEGRRYYIDLPGTEAYYFDKLMSELEILKLYFASWMEKEELETISGYRPWVEDIFPALAKKFRLPADWDYRDFYGAVLEACAKKMDMEVFRVYSAEDIIGPVYKFILGNGPAEGLNGYSLGRKK